METQVTFIDATGTKVTIDIKITDGVLSMSGNYGTGNFGQMYDSIKPNSEAQKQLIGIWKRWHLNDLPEDIEDQIESIIDDIEAEEDERQSGADLSEMDEDELIEWIEENTSFIGNEAEIIAGAVQIWGLCADDVERAEIDGNRLTINGCEYLAGDDADMEAEWEEYLENHINECELFEVPERLHQFIDMEAMVDYYKQDGRGHSLNRYDGGEESTTVNGTEYYYYQQ